MIVAVVAVRVMQVAIDQVVNVITVRNRFVAAVRAMNVSGIVPITVVFWGAISRVGRSYRDGMLFDDTVISHPVKMTVVQVVGVILMLDRRMSTVRAMDVIVVVMCVVCHVDLHV